MTLREGSITRLEQIEEILLTEEKIEEILPRKMGEQIEEIPHKTGEQTAHICLSADVPGDSSDNSVGEQEVTQPSKSSVKEMTPQ